LYQRAVDLATQALRVDPRDVDARISLADFYAKLGDRNRAAEQMNQLPADLSDPHVLVFGAVVHMDMADRDAALSSLERAHTRGLPGGELRDWIELDPLKMSRDSRR